MNPKQLFLDFLDTMFAIGLSIFAFLYFIAGDNLWIAKRTVETLAPIAYFSIFFFIKLKFVKKDYHKFVKEDNLEEIIFYATKKDRLMDKTVAVLLGIIIVLISRFVGVIYMEDIVQGVGVVLFLLAWHFYLFRKHESVNEMRYITRFDKILDQIVVFVLPIFIYAISLSFMDADTLDVIQALGGLGGLYLWRKYMYKR